MSNRASLSDLLHLLEACEALPLTLDETAGVLTQWTRLTFEHLRSFETATKMMLVQGHDVVEPP